MKRHATLLILLFLALASCSAASPTVQEIRDDCGGSSGIEVDDDGTLAITHKFLATDDGETTYGMPYIGIGTWGCVNKAVGLPREVAEQMTKQMFSTDAADPQLAEWDGWQAAWQKATEGDDLLFVIYQPIK